MHINITQDTDAAWRLPFSILELALILDSMWLELARFGQEHPAPCTNHLSKCDSANLALDLALVDDEEMARLNETFLNCSGPTNILAFPVCPDQNQSWLSTSEEQEDTYPAHWNGVNQIGWLALSPRTLMREAMLYGQQLPLYTLRLLAHGLAHLMGHEHGEAMEQATSSALQTVLAELNTKGII